MESYNQYPNAPIYQQYNDGNVYQYNNGAEGFPQLSPYKQPAQNINYHHPPPPAYSKYQSRQPTTTKAYGHHPCWVYCQTCQMDVVSKVSQKHGQSTCAFSMILCLMGGPLCLPFLCFLDTKDTVHTCPNCHKHLGTVQLDMF